ncbi:MAG: universal stress protein UspE [Gammaproteobacteria bacterium]|nr:MAG: universal stress protein UspE [Gammaproteobacteria bacterium]
MDKLNKIIVIFDEKQEQQTAIERALELARLTRANIHVIATIFSNINVTFSHLQLDTEAIIRESMLNRLNKDLKSHIDSLDTSQVNISYETLWSPRPSIDIAEICESQGFDLLIKTANKHHLFDGVFHTPLDWHLLRECPCAVMLVSNKQHAKDRPLIVAIDANSDDHAHSSLNDKLLDSAQYFSKIFKDEIIAVNACPPLPVMTDLEYASIDPSSYIEEMKKIASANTLKVIRQFNLNESNMKILEGIPEVVIPGFAEQIDSPLIILGTVSRSGLSGFFLGNTAEHLLYNLQCDILAIKPDGFDRD